MLTIYYTVPNLFQPVCSLKGSSLVYVITDPLSSHWSRAVISSRKHQRLPPIIGTSTAAVTCLSVRLNSNYVRLPAEEVLPYVDQLSDCSEAWHDIEGFLVCYSVLEDNVIGVWKSVLTYHVNSLYISFIRKYERFWINKNKCSEKLTVILCTIN